MSSLSVVTPDFDKMTEDQIIDYIEGWKKRGVTTLGSWKKLQVNLDVLETGIFPLDMAIGCKGPDGRLGIRARDIVEIFGEPGSGKSALVELLMKTTLDRFGPYSVGALYAEPPETERMENAGINLDHVLARICIDPDVDIKKNLAEDQLESMLKLAEDPNTRLVIIDSLAALITTSQIFEKDEKTKRDLDQNKVAALANVFNNFLLQWLRRNKNAVLVIVNHYKPNLETSSFGMISELIKTPGGRLKEFLANVRVFVRSRLERTEDKHDVEDTKRATHLKNSFEIVKNKYSHSTSNRTVKSELDFATGKRNNEAKILEYASFFGTIQKIKEKSAKGKEKEKKVLLSELTPGVASSGAWMFIGNGEEMKALNGLAQASDWLLQNPEVYDKLKYQLYARSPVFFENKKPTFEAQLDGVQNNASGSDSKD